MSAAAELRKAAQELRAAREQSLKKAGGDARKDFNAAAASATGGDRKYSGEPKSTLSVTIKVAGGSRRSTLTISPTKASAGQWVWADTGTKPGARRHRSGRRRGTVMNHPGTAGRGAWSKTEATVVPRILNQIANDIAKVFR